MNTSDKQRVIPMTVFANAAIAFFKCQPEDIQIRMIAEDKEALILYNNEAYKISTRDTLQDDVEDMLSHTDHAQNLNLSIWIGVTKNTVTIGRILPNLVRKIKDTDQLQMLHLALAISSYSEDRYQTFWQALDSIDPTGDILANAVVATREVYNGDGLIEDITEKMILDGINQYNHLVGGIFGELYPEPYQNDYTALYLYSVDDMSAE